MIRDKYPHLAEGMRVRVYTVSLEGVPAVIKTINQYGNLFVVFDEIQYHNDWDGDKDPYSGQIVHPRQVEEIK